MPDCEILVIGGGAAGLNAARILAQAGRQVILLEARQRLGGRIHSFADERFPIPVELGAEFIHGQPPATCDLVKHYKLDTYELPGDHWQHRQGRLEHLKDFMGAMRPVSRALHRHFRRGGDDMTLDAFFRRIAEPKAEGAFTARRRRRLHESAAMARSFFEGFDAVDPADASARALSEELEGVGDVGGQTQLRLRHGYGALVDALASAASAAGAVIRPGTPVRAIRWSGDGVEVKTDGGAVSAERVIVTLPVGIVQDESAVRFEPELPRKRAAARLLGTGPVVPPGVLGGKGSRRTRHRRAGGGPLGPGDVAHARRRVAHLVDLPADPRAGDCGLERRPCRHALDGAAAGGAAGIGASGPGGVIER